MKLEPMHSAAWKETMWHDDKAIRKKRSMRAFSFFCDGSTAFYILFLKLIGDGKSKERRNHEEVLLLVRI